MTQQWSIGGMLASEFLFGLVYAFLVVRRVNTATQRITHYEVIVGVAVVLLIALAWQVISLGTFALIFAAFAAAGFSMWLEYEGRAAAELHREERNRDTKAL